MWPIVSDVALSASLLVTSVSPAKLAEQIEVSLGCGLKWDPRTMYPVEGSILRLLYDTDNKCITTNVLAKLIFQDPPLTKHNDVFRTSSQFQDAVKYVEYPV